MTTCLETLGLTLCLISAILQSGITAITLGTTMLNIVIFCIITLSIS